MAKAKKRRLAKEIDKLWRTARYWDWLKLVEQEGLVQAQSAQWQEAWRHLTRSALRRPGHLEEFCRHLGELHHVPEFPDLVMIRQVKDFLADKEVRPAIEALTGLSPAAQLFREKLLSWSEAAVQEKKISRLLKTLLTQPEKVTGRAFTELGTLVAPNPLAETIGSLSQAINQVRRFNSKTAQGRRTRAGLEDQDLKFLDDRLDRLAGSLDPVLREILFYPFIYQIAQHFERLVAREDFDELSHLAAVGPFLFSQAAGSQAEYLKDRCRSLAGGVATVKEAEDYLKQALTQDWESQVAALGKIRLALKSLDPSAKLLQDCFLLYLQVLKEIRKRQKDLSPRDQLDLMRVMDPIIFSDLEWLPDHPSDIVFVLGQAIDAGCGGALVCTLILLHPGADRILKRKAAATLQELPYPGDPAINQVLASLAGPIFPHVRLVKPLLELYPTEAGLRGIVFDCLRFDAKMLLLTNAMALKYEPAMEAPKKMMRVLQDTVTTLKNDLHDFNEYEEAIVLQDLFECFSEGYLTGNGYHSLFLKIYGRQKSFDYLFAQLDTYCLTADLLDQDVIFFTLSNEWLDKQEDLLFDFVVEHGEDLKTAPFDTVRHVVDRFCQPEFMAPKGLNFFLGLGDQIRERGKAGELAAEALHNRIMSLILEYRQNRKQTRRTRR